MSLKVFNLEGLKILIDITDKSRQSGECKTRKMTVEERKKYGEYNPVKAKFTNVFFNNNDHKRRYKNLN